ncbi:MAG TPA: hypothetical protein VE422_31110 [Terriglobia bacterium]|nr:hypothetical protein [Terriglobia bacterium]
MRTKRLATIPFLVILALTSCQKKTARVATPPPVSTPSPVSAPAPRTDSRPPAPAVLERADRAFTTGAYDDAIRDYEQGLRLSPPSNEREQALFRLSLAYALRSTNPDWQRATMLLKQLVDEYPNGVLKPPAALILSLHSDLDQLAARDQRIRQLTTELERLKQIDAQRRTRP